MTEDGEDGGCIGPRVCVSSSASKFGPYLYYELSVFCHQSRHGQLYPSARGSLACRKLALESLVICVIPLAMIIGTKTIRLLFARLVSFSSDF